MIPSTDDHPATAALRIRVETLIGRIGDDLEVMRRRIDTLSREQYPTCFENSCEFHVASSTLIAL
ncbi:MAG: hypothetical protein HY709_05925 [Candidatus Latescibacteria bacterium]|nr:hypothetical protein [Candidatus Latescibacterota bacterium]